MLEGGPGGSQVDGLINSKEIGDNFARHSKKSCSALYKNCSERLSQCYESQRSNYAGSPLMTDNHCDAELVETLIEEMKRGKAAGLDGLSVEHLSNVLSSYIASNFSAAVQFNCNNWSRICSIWL